MIGNVYAKLLVVDELKLFFKMLHVQCNSFLMSMFHLRMPVYHLTVSAFVLVLNLF